ncbi:MAG: ATP-binding protein, partial [Duganella sp.]
GQLRQLRADVFEESVFEVKERIAAAWACQDEQPAMPAFLQEVAELLAQWAGFRPRSANIAWVDVYPAPPASKAPQQATLPMAAPAVTPDPDAPADELPILNSFFYHDLSQAAATLAQPDALPNPLACYLSGAPVAKLDLETAEGERDIHATLDPLLTNAGRWPTEPVLLQSLMQQYALNKMRALQPGEILSVNGPPGTGKTTLVKDLIADIIIERAAVLATLDKARDGLGPNVTIGFGSESLTLPSLIPALTGAEILVASSNNGAVENLSLELPQLKEIAADYRDTLRHFGEVATKYAGAQAGTWQQPKQPVWGLVAAALGKSKNRQRFQQVFNYTGKTPTDRQGRFVANRDVDMAAWEAEGAMSYWRFIKERKTDVASFDQAKRRFVAARAGYAQYQASQVALRRQWLAFVDAWQAARAALGLHAEVAPELAPMIAELDDCIGRLGRRLAQVELTLWPSMLRWLMRWFSRRKFQDWLEARSAVLRAAGLRDELDIVRKLQQKTGQLRLWDGATLDSHRNQEAALWQGEQFNRLRNELFAAAMALHQAFVIEAATAEVGMALGKVVSRRISDGSPLPAWQWLFMLTPVVSSTFASVRSQFRGVGEGSFGWLIVDEAGQAVPQAAVGALLRAQRAVVVGDPLQIEPVVGVPVRLLNQLGQLWLGDQAEAYGVHRQSVQTLADRAHRYGVRHPHRPQEFIGIPLVMHRRCDNPMFDIANKIAYRERMRHAKDGAMAPHPVLGMSAWWDVKGRCADSKYVVAQGELVLERLVALYLGEVAQGRDALPHMYVITPFREVKTGLTQLLLDASAWTQQLARQGAAAGVALPANLAALRTAIGTVHTFQGKEADIVFFVLGCDEDRGGAMAWASGSANLLNVAVTRAKKHCYIVGDQALWGTLDFFKVAVQEYARLPGRAENLPG